MFTFLVLCCLAGALWYWGVFVREFWLMAYYENNRVAQWCLAALAFVILIGLLRS